MSQGFQTLPSDARSAVAALLEHSPPVLIEVRFPHCATSPDWHLCEDEAELDQILDRLAPGAELHVSSVWDLKNPRGAITFRRG